MRSPTRTSQGFLRVDGYASRVGVYEYTNPDGTTRRELRPPEEVFRDDALASFEGASFTDGHPARSVTADNARALEVGTVTVPARREDDRVVASIMIKDPKAIAKVEAGKHELSPGYSIDLDETPGSHPKYGRYDAVQRNIKINHLALVDRARGGSDMRIRMDGMGELAAEIDPKETIKESDTVSEQNTMSPDEQIALLKTEGAALKVRADSAEAESKKHKERADAAEQKLDVVTKAHADTESTRLDAAKELAGEEMQKLRERADSAERDLGDLRDSVAGLVARRADLVLRARAVTGRDFRGDAADRVIQESIIKKLEPTFRADGLSDVQIQARADALYDSRVKTAESLTRAGEVLSGSTARQVRTDSKEARAQAWREQATNPKAFRAAFGTKEEG